MVIPFQELLPETLRALLEDFVSRDGAIHGHAEATMDQKVGAVMQQLRAGSAVIVFDADDETCSVVEKRSLSRPPTDSNSGRVEN